MEEKKEDVDIILVTYERPLLLKKTIKKINERTMYPFNLIVVDNCSQDEETNEILNVAQKRGDVQKRIRMEENLGLPSALNEGLKHVKSEYFICTQDDLIPPDLRPCWLERLVHLYKKYEDDYAGLCMRIQRTARLNMDEDEELIYSPKSLPAVFRISRRDDFLKNKIDFGTRKHWESHSFAQLAKSVLKKKTAMVTKLIADHTGYMLDNKGFPIGKRDFHTYSGEDKMRQNIDKPYPDIDDRTHTPKIFNHPYDRHEIARIEEWLSSRSDGEEEVMDQQDILGKYCKGIGLDICCGKNRKCHPDAIGIDINPYSRTVDIVHDGADLWMYPDDSLDYIVSCHGLEHFPDTIKTVDEWARVIKPGGHVAVIVPDALTRPENIRAKGHKSAWIEQTLFHLFRHDFKSVRCGQLRDIGDERKKVLIYVGIRR